MEEMTLNAIAMFASASAVVLTTVPALFRAARNWYPATGAHQLEIQVDHETFVLDAKAIGETDPAEVHQVVEAVREANRIAA